MAIDLDTPALPDVQADRPSVALALPRVGVTGVEKTIRTGDDTVLSARLSCFVDLGAGQKGAHMSRFEEGFDEAIAAASQQGRAPALDALAGRIAEGVRERQAALRCEVAITARVPRVRVAPVTGAVGREHFTVLATAVASGAGTRRLLGVTAQGMTACPCAQGLLTEAARERLGADGFSPDEVERIFAHVPVATHNQRGLGTLQVGVPPGEDHAVDPLLLLEIVESSMSSEIYELMKRPDEAAVVEKAHRRPRFVEDCVREMLAGVADRLGALPADTLVSARQENLETIHQHDVVAEYTGLLGDLLSELATGEPPERQASAREWLAGAADEVRSVRLSPKK